MKLITCFDEFLKEIRPTQNQIGDFQTGHTTLRERLAKEEDLSSIIVTTFLQGSYRRSTAVRPKAGKRADVDIIVVTRLDKAKFTPNEAMDVFVPFLRHYYKDKYRKQGRSFGIELSYVDLDLVITSAPSEYYEEAALSDLFLSDANIEIDPHLFSRNARGEEIFLRESVKDTDPIWIPNRDTATWERTNPLKQIRWTINKNARCNGHYVNVVKAIKWWQRVKHEADRPSGYPLEHLIGHFCPDNIMSVPEGVTLTLENFKSYFEHLDDDNEIPFYEDHGVPEHNVLGRVSSKEFLMFRSHVEEAALIAREALDAEGAVESASKWQELFGDKFPIPSEESKKIAIISKPSLSDFSHCEPLQWPFINESKVRVDAYVYSGDKKNKFGGINSNGRNLSKNLFLEFVAKTKSSNRVKYYWQVVNTGEAARQANDLRGRFFEGKRIRWEHTKYPGKHWIECFLVKDERCIARSGKFFVNIKAN